MLLPKRVKYRRPHRVSYEGKAKGKCQVSFGEYGLQALEGAWITNRQIEAARIAITRYMRRDGKVWINIFPHLAYCYVYPSGYGELDLDTMTAYNKVTVFAPGDYSPDRMLYGTNDDLTHAQKVMPSGLWVEAIKNRKQGGQFSWSLINSGWIGYNHMWEGD